jgi:hypothetical protein
MRHSQRAYIEDWVKQAPRLRKPYMREYVPGFISLGRLLYDNPSMKHSSTRDNLRRVRQSLALLYDLLDIYSPIDTIVILNKIGHSFLTCFYLSDGALYLRPHDDMCLSPIYYAIKTLFNRHDLYSTVVAEAHFMYARQQRVGGS